MLGEWAIHADEYGLDAIGLIVRRTRTELLETFERARAIYTPMAREQRREREQGSDAAPPAGLTMR